VSGRSPEEARQILQDAELAVAPDQVTKEVDDDEDVGKVVATDPNAGQPVSKGSPVKLIVGKEKETSEVPDQTGQNVDAARATLEGLGFEVEVNEVDADQPAGTVVDQDPKSGEQEPGTTVTLDVSKGPNQDQFQMPNIVGLTQQEAEQQLRQLGWTGNFDVQDGQTDDPNEFNRIIDSNRGEGQQVDKDDTIGITVATEFGQGGG
jgi:serine/threonine-protein kinase